MNCQSLSDKQKRHYIKRYVDNDVLDRYTTISIYKIIRDNDGLSPIRNSKTAGDAGVFIDLNKVSSSSIELIFNSIKKRVESIAIK